VPVRALPAWCGQLAAAWLGCKVGRGRPLTSLLLGGLTPAISLNVGSRFQGCYMVPRARGPDFRLPTAPADGHDRYR